MSTKKQRPKRYTLTLIVQSETIRRWKMTRLFRNRQAAEAKARRIGDFGHLHRWKDGTSAFYPSARIIRVEVAPR